MTTFLTYTTIGLVVGCLYALTASGLVVTYTTSRIFNFAHGAIGMVAAFLFWQLWVDFGWHPLVALLFILLVVAPLFGALVERTLMRRLYGASLEVNLVVTLGLLVFLVGVANIFWDPGETTRTLPRFFAGRTVKVFSVFVDYHQLIVVAVSVAVAVGLRLFFSRTRTGITMRAVVDNRDLAAMAGARPARMAQLSWALGATLAALAGILLAPLQYLDINVLTLLIINAFAAAMVGRLRSLPHTVVGALILGLAVTYAVGYLPIGGFLSRIQTAIPMALLFIVLIVMRQEPLRLGTASGLRVPRVPTMRQSLVSAAAFVVVAALIAPHLSSVNLSTGARGLVLGVVLLSLVLLTGYSGQVSLAQMSFVGVGAWTMGQVGGDGGSLLGVVAAAALAAAFGAVVAIPTLRLRGLYLALATLAFAQAMDYVFFNEVLAGGNNTDVARVHIPGIPTDSDEAFFILLAAVFALAGVLVLAIRRGRYGRRLAALNDSPAACATLGLNIIWTKLAVFTTAAAIAGMAGALYGGQQGIISPNDFFLFNSLTMLLLLLIGGRNTVAGAFLGAMFFATFPIIQDHLPSLSNVQFLFTGLGAITIGQNPNGIGGQLADLGEMIRHARHRRREPVPPTAQPLAELA